MENTTGPVIIISRDTKDVVIFRISISRDRKEICLHMRTDGPYGMQVIAVLPKQMMMGRDSQHTLVPITTIVYP